MRKRLSQLDETNRSLLADARDNEPLVIENDRGEGEFEILRLASEQAQAAAWRDIEELQQDVGRSMRTHGISEADVDQLLAEDT